MFVLVSDQINSRKDKDRVENAIYSLKEINCIRGFERTSGDEFQGLLEDPHAVADAVQILMRDGHWRIGLGIGGVNEPLNRSVRECGGPAFWSARDAVNECRRLAPPQVAVRGPGQWCSHAETALRLATNLDISRSELGRAAVDIMRKEMNQAKAAAAMGISPQALSQRLRSAKWTLEDPTWKLALAVLALAGSEGA